MGITPAIRPNRFETKKDDQYHIDYARWAISSVNKALHFEYTMKCIVNWYFYAGKQWVFEEDLDVFFKDETGEVRNRIRMTKNIIKPMVRQFEGNTIETDYSMAIIANSEDAETRRNLSLSELLIIGKTAREIPESLAKQLRDTHAIGDSDIETKKRFEALYVDEYAQKITQMCKCIAERNELDDSKIRQSRHMALDGIAVYENYEHDGDMVTDVVDPKFFFWDRSAEKPTLTDSQYQGRFMLMEGTSIYERFVLKPEARNLIEGYITKDLTNNNAFGIHNTVNTLTTAGRIPVYKVYWKDSDREEWGYVDDGTGYPMFTRVNYEGGEYTDDDLIYNANIPYSLKPKFKNNKLKTTIYNKTTRYCWFIPSEVVGGVEGQDIVLESGIAPYTDSESGFPFVCSTWSYENGEVLTPIDDIIDPQRFINRCLSVMESHINQAGGTGSIIDKDMLEGSDGEYKALKAMRNGDPVFVNAGGQLNNSIGTYDTTLKTSADVMMRIVEGVSRISEEVTGVTDTMKGTAGGYRQLVGVQEIQIQRGTLLQEPFYYAITSLMKGVYKDYADRGKRIYADSRRRLSEMVGDKYARQFVITKDMALEDYNSKVERVSSQSDQINFVNNQILTFAQLGYLDQDGVALLWGKGDQFMLSIELRKHAAKAGLIKSQQAQEQQQAQQQQGITQQQALQQQQAQFQQTRIDNQVKDESNKEHDLDKILLNNLTKPVTRK